MDTTTASHAALTSFEPLFADGTSEFRHPSDVAGTLAAPGGDGSAGERRALLPAGDVTFLFTDIEGSTRLASGLGAERYRVVLHRHRALVREVLRAAGGVEIDTEGDSFFVAFHDAAAACAAAVGIQTALHGASWPDQDGAPLRPRVRMGLHTGEAWPSAGGYATPEVHKTARICSAAHGDQILASAACAAAAGLPPERTRRLGDFELRGLPGVTELVQVTAPGLPEEFPPPPVRPRRHNLPHALKPPVERPEDARELDRAFAVSRMVTLSGLPGCGKTTFARAWARKRLSCYEHGVWYSNAGPDLGKALLDALDLRSEPLREPMRTVIDHFRDRQALLVVDDTDQLGAERRGELLLLLESCPDLHLLAVGRRPLDLPGAVKRALDLPAGGVGAAMLAGFCEDRGAPWTAADCRGLAAAVENFPPALLALADLVALASPQAALRRLRDDPVAVLDAGGRFRAAIDDAVAAISGPARAVLLELAARERGASVDEVLDLCRQRDGSLEALVELVDAALVVIERPAMDQAVYRVPAPLRWLLAGPDAEPDPAPLTAGFAERLVHPVAIDAPRLRAVALRGRGGGLRPAAAPSVLGTDGAVRRRAANRGCGAALRLFRAGFLGPPLSGDIGGAGRRFCRTRGQCWALWSPGGWGLGMVLYLSHPPALRAAHVAPRNPRARGERSPARSSCSCVTQAPPRPGGTQELPPRRAGHRAQAEPVRSSRPGRTGAAIASGPNRCGYRLGAEPVWSSHPGRTGAPRGACAMLTP